MSRIRIAMSALAAAPLLIAPPALAHSGDEPPTAPAITVVSRAVAAPFNLELAHGRVLVADGMANLIGSLNRDGSLRTLAADQPGASGIATSRDGRTMAFTTTVTDFSTFVNSESGLNVWGPKGKSYVDTHAYEVKHNPDKVNHYGVKNPSQCVADALGALGAPASYTGQVDSHAYSVAAFRDGWVIADAGANVLWRVDHRGRLGTLAVLPPQPTTITAEQAGAMGLPDCVVGVTYAFEPVPTDVEVGRDGQLYVTTLPGGPESPVLGARGSVYRVNPYSGRVKLVATGFLGATNLAIGRGGEIYVTEFFAGRVSVLRHGRISTYVELPGALAVEARGSVLWAGTMGDQASGTPGTIVRIG